MTHDRIIEANGFGFKLSLSGPYLSYLCYQTPEELKSKNFTNLHYHHQLSDQSDFKISSRSNPSLVSLSHVFVQGSYDDLSLKPFIYDLRQDKSLHQKYQDRSITQDDLYNLYKTFADNLEEAISHFNPSLVIPGYRLEDQSGDKLLASQRTSLLAKAEQPLTSKPTPSQLPPLPSLPKARKTPNRRLKEGPLSITLTSLTRLSSGIHTITAGLILRDTILAKVKSAQERNPEKYQLLTLSELLSPKNSKRTLFTSKNIFLSLDQDPLTLPLSQALLTLQDYLSYFLSSPSLKGHKLFVISQDYGLASIPMKSEDRELIRDATELLALVKKYSRTSRWLTSPTSALISHPL